MRLMLDTNRYDDLNDGLAAVVERVKLAEEVWLSFIVLGELRAGFLKGSQARRNERILSKFLSQPGVGFLLPTAQTTEIYARIWVELKKHGTRIPTNDVWIAAQAVEHDLILDTRDQHFSHVSGLKLVPAT